MTTRKAYPRPQFVREAWQNLNGSWQFCFDDNNEGLAEKWYLDENRVRGLSRGSFYINVN